MCTLGPLLTGRSKQELRGRSLEAAHVMERAGAVFGFTTDHPVTPSYSLSLAASCAVGAGMTRSSFLVRHGSDDPETGS